MTNQNLPAPYYCGRGVTLYHSDFRNILPLLKPDTIDALISDPPYGNTDLEWDKTIDWKFFWTEAHRLCKPNSPIVLFSSGKFVYQLIHTNPAHYRYELIWEKNMPVGHLDANRRPLRSHETILFFSKTFRGSTYHPQMVEGKWHTIGKGKPPKHYRTATRAREARKTNLYHPKSVLRFNNSRSRSLHPTQKPLDLMQWLVRTYSNRFDQILDPFAGSGSTLAAAALDGRRSIGIEQNEAYCEIIANRLEKGD